MSVDFTINNHHRTWIVHWRLTNAVVALQPKFHYNVLPRQVSKMVKTAQIWALQETLCQKMIHGVFFKQCLKHLRVSHLALWLMPKSGHKSTDCCCTGWGDPHSRLPTESVKTGHSTNLSNVPQCSRDSRSCPVVLWTTFMDAVQTAPRQGPVPNGVDALQKAQHHSTGKPEVGAIGLGRSSCAWEFRSETGCWPTDRQLTERRPDLVAYYRELRRIVIYEVTCAREPLIKEQQHEKRGKYRELAWLYKHVLLWHAWNVSCQRCHKMITAGFIHTYLHFHHSISEFLAPPTTLSVQSIGNLISMTYTLSCALVLLISATSTIRMYAIYQN